MSSNYCKECGKLLKLGAKNCSQCGTYFPIKKAFVGLGVILVLFKITELLIPLIEVSSESSKLVLTKDCIEASKTIGVPNHKITPDELSRAVACIPTSK